MSEGKTVGWTIAGFCILLSVAATDVALAQEKEPRETPGLALVFDAVEAEFDALKPLLSMSMEEKAKAVIRGRLVFCAMLMGHCADVGVTVTREKASCGFEQHKVTKEWIQKYLDQVSQYPEWKDRNTLIMGVLAKVSG